MAGRFSRAWIAAAAAALIAAAAPAGPEARILAGESASAVLNEWCAAHGLPALHADLAAQAAKAPSPAVRAALAATPGEAVLYRRVRLACGTTAVSEADNWYLPDKLTPEMNRRLTTSDAPFGLVVRPLGFTRRTVATKALRRGGLEIRAVLVTGAGTPFSYVVEDYAARVR
jgi:hypothetical protein